MNGTGAASHHDPTSAALASAGPPVDASRVRTLTDYQVFFDGLEYSSLGYDFDALPVDGGTGYRRAQPGTPRSVPYSKRQPISPSRLGRTIVGRFTAALFSQRNRPAVRVLGDPDTDDWVDGAIKASKFWTKLVEARNKAGSTGTAVMSWAIHSGHPVIEVHNPAHVTPVWEDRARGTLSAINIRFEYPRQERQTDGTIKTVWYIYRREINQTHDTVYQPWPKKKRSKPNWVPHKEVAHPFGRCPAVWVQNTPDSEAIDGCPDYFGQLDSIREHDRQHSHAFRGTAKNCDPTLSVTLGQGQNMPESSGELQKGSDHAIILKSGGSVSYAEMVGTGIAHARDNAARLKDQILEACDCVLDSESSVEMTATEVNDRRQAMRDRTDLYRSQWGPAIVDLLDMLIACARSVESVRLVPVETPEPSDENDALSEDEEGELPPQGPPVMAVKGRIIVPPRIIEDDDDPTKPAQIVDRKLGTAPRWLVQVDWPDHAKHLPADVLTWQQTLDGSVQAGWVDVETAARKWAALADIPNAREAFVKAQEAKTQRDAAAAAAQDAMSQRLLQGLENPPAPPQPEPDVDEE